MVADLPAWLLRDSWETCNSTQEFSPDSRGKSAVTWLSPHQPAVFVYFQTTDWLDIEHFFSFVFIYVQIIFKDVEQD